MLESEIAVSWNLLSHVLFRGDRPETFELYRFLCHHNKTISVKEC